MVFANRIEVWNPGGLPEDLTVDQLGGPHPSVPRNRLICEPLYLAHYIERAGTGTLDMISLCLEAGLPEPEFRSEGERFVTGVWRDWLTDEVLATLDLGDRQRSALAVLHSTSRLTSGQYQEQTGVSRQTAFRDLEDMVRKGVLERHGERETRGGGVQLPLSSPASRYSQFRDSQGTDPAWTPRRPT